MKTVAHRDNLAVSLPCYHTLDNLCQFTFPTAPIRQSLDYNGQFDQKALCPCLVGLSLTESIPYMHLFHGLSSCPQISVLLTGNPPGIRPP